MRSARSVVSIVGRRRSPPSFGAGTETWLTPPTGCHWCAPAGLLVSSHSWPKRLSKKPLPHCVGVAVQVTSRPDVIASWSLPVPYDCFQPRPCSSIEAPSGSRPTYSSGIGGAVRLAEGVAAGDQRDGLLVVHGHAAERLADVARGGDRVRVAVRALRVDVDQAHLHGAERLLELTVARVALVAEPLGLRAPVDVLVRLPHVGAAAGEAERLQAHRLQRDVAGEDHQVGPRERSGRTSS